MAAKAELLGSAPGSARIRLHGTAGLTAITAIQIRRNQGTEVYLGLDGQWQASPDCWHKVAAGAVATVGERVEIAIGPLLVDPIVRVLAGNAFMVSWRAGEKTDAATLVPSSQSPLLASDARQAPPPPSVTPPVPDEEPADDMPVTPGSTVLRPGVDDRIAPIETRSSGRGGLLVTGLVVLSLVAVAAGYYWYSVNGAGPVDPATQAEAGDPSTRAMLVGFMNEKPDTTAIVGKADEMMKAGNSEAAVYLYRQGSDRGDARSALQLGLLYAPDGPPVSDSKFTKSSDTAAFWYSKAAEAGLAEAQRRLGDILTKSHPAGTGEFDAGVTWLKAASKQGDAEAAARLKELGQ